MRRERHDRLYEHGRWDHYCEIKVKEYLNDDFNVKTLNSWNIYIYFIRFVHKLSKSHTLDLPRTMICPHQSHLD